MGKQPAQLSGVSDLFRKQSRHRWAQAVIWESKVLATSKTVWKYPTPISNIPSFSGVSWRLSRSEPAALIAGGEVERLECSWVRSPRCTSQGQALGLCPQGQGHGCLLCVAGSRQIQGNQKKSLDSPISVPPVAGQARVLEIPSPAVVVGRVPLPRLK